MATIEDQRRLFDQHCKERFQDREDATGTSKTIWREKGKRIVNVLKSEPAAQHYSPKFKFWVKKRGFELISYSPLGLCDVVCLPAKKNVSHAA